MRSLRIPRGRRLLALVAIFAVAIIFVIRLADVQLVSAAALNADARDKRAVPVTIPSVRGDILDRNDSVLASTDELYDVQLSPKNTRINGGKFYRQEVDGGIGTVEVTNAEAYAEIGEITGQSADEIAKIVDDALENDPKSDFAYVTRSVDLTQLNRLKELMIPWLTFESHHERSFPNGAVAGNLIGFSGYGEEPQSGVELSQDACLTGKDGQEEYERSEDGVPLPGSVVVTEQAEDGGDVKLSIDRDLNWQAQQIINEQVEEVSAEWGYLVIMDVRTGELVAVAEDGSVDPNDVSASDPAKRESRSFVSPYEPGSTFKAVTAAALIDQGLADPSTQQLTPGQWEPEPGVRFGDATAHGEERWTLNGIMVNSSNVGISMLGDRLDSATLYDYITKFGVGESTHAGMPLEDSGMLFPADQWDRQTSYNIRFGQGVSTTIVQTAGIYQAIANGGERIPPTLVESCTKPDGTVTKPDHGDPVQAISGETAGTMMHVLESVANESWVKDHVSIPGYRIAGKTGTAEQSDGQGGYRSDYVSSFAGIFPADDPQYVAVASVAFPANPENGGLAATAAFREAAEATIRTFHIPPSSGKYDPLPVNY
ncbi:penicillin-binding protein PbpB [Leucobacter sp. Psy1]|uniref:peptidoglycan D,D-transpeptidase FtsI family protein n=1 Tax=Leucobacter sp. Psy1 TaxID=2875729 RepID=UPI001CD54BFA|nr:penicillin-binding protein 2 [Leucobacter sp. Psy1]UBH06362.1 penicillin-binding protein PbpB [Leucobacter sp. Psy1]